MGVTVVITPLIALLNDQIAKLKNHGMHVCYISSSLSSEERDLIFHELTKEIPSFKFLYLTPESALSPGLLPCGKSFRLSFMTSNSLNDPLQRSLEQLQPKPRRGLWKSWG